MSGLIEAILKEVTTHSRQCFWQSIVLWLLLLEHINYRLPYYQTFKTYFTLYINFHRRRKKNKGTAAHCQSLIRIGDDDDETANNE